MLRSEQAGKLDELEEKHERLMEKYKALKAENKSLKLRAEEAGGSAQVVENLKEQCVELKERNRLLAQKLDLYEIEQKPATPLK